MNGFVQVYTGDGKGKTTAALGLALRAAGAGLRVFLARFMKHGKSSELVSLERFGDLVTVRSYGRPGFVSAPPAPEDIASARAGFIESSEAVVSGTFPVVILDEANTAVHAGLLPVGDIISLIDHRPRNVELVLTGRGAHPLVMERADLVTEMREVKHYFRSGVPARKGIEE